MCCLKYESETYRESNQMLPAVGSKVEYQGKEGTVVQINMLKETLVIQSPRRGTL